MSDRNGNTRTNGANTYAYDAENRLTNYTSATATFVYNGDGVRVRKTAGGTTTLYLVDDRNPTGYAQVLEEATVSGGATNLAKVYTYGLDLIAQRDVNTGLRTFYGYDGNGNTRYLTGTNASVMDTYVYDAFGTLLTSTGTTPNSYRYAGEQLDSDLGFYYLRARYLNPGTGRFWSRDAFAGVPIEPSSLHRYLYVNQNPVNKRDPSGLFEGAFGSLGGLSIGGTIESLPTLVISKAFVKVVATAAVIALTLTGDSIDGNFVYRRLSDDQAAQPFRTVGITATDPGALNVTPSDHIEGRDLSPWISSSRRFDVPLRLYRDNPRNPIIQIDLNQVPGFYLDFTNPILLATLRDDFVRGLAALTSEVLIFAYVPPRAIVGVTPGR